MTDVRPRIRAILFDVGGTLVYEPDMVGWSEQARPFHLGINPDDLARAYIKVLAEIGKFSSSQDWEGEIVDFWRRTLSLAARKVVSRSIASKFVAANKERSLPVRLYSDACPCLDQLRQDHRPLGIISNSDSETRVRQVLELAGILDYFDRIVSSGTEGIEKPNPTIFLRAVRRMNVKPAEALYIGNKADVDARAARSAGLHGVWVNRGGPGLGTDPSEVASLLEVPVCVRRIEQGVLVT